GACRRSPARRHRGWIRPPPRRRRRSSPRLHPREDLAEFAGEPASRAGLQDPPETLFHIAHADVEEFRETLVPDRAAQGLGISPESAQSLRREAEGQPHMFHERPPRARSRSPSGCSLYRASSKREVKVAESSRETRKRSTASRSSSRGVSGSCFVMPRDPRSVQKRWKQARITARTSPPLSISWIASRTVVAATTRAVLAGNVSSQSVASPCIRARRKR